MRMNIPNASEAVSKPEVMRTSASTATKMNDEVRSRPQARALSAIFVLNSLRVGGSETKTVRLVNALQARGVGVGIAYLDESDALLSVLDARVPIWCLERRGKFSPRALANLRRLIRRHAPSAVFSVNLYPALYLSLATRALSRRPRTIALLNTTSFPKGEEWRRTFYRPFLRRMDELVYGCALQSREWAQFLGTKATCASVIYNGVDTEHFAPPEQRARASIRADLGLSPDTFVVGTVGRLAVEKNQRALIEALAALRARGTPAHVLIVGEGPKRAELERQAADAGLAEHVTLAGVHRDVRPLLSAMDVFVLPSTHIETFSNAALEAMAMRTPVILSRVGGATEMVRDGIDGYTLEVAQLSSELPTLLQRLYEDRALRERLARAARERVVERFSMQSMVDEFASLMREREATVGAQ